jgi:transcriptional regulator with GAF, ATPase, and Fis domain
MSTPSAMSTPRSIAETAAVPPAGPMAPADRHLMSTAQRQQIERVLQQVGGNKAAAAKLLGMSRRSLYRWLDRLDVDH